MERKRLYAIDELRGVAIILMVIYHFIFDLYMQGYAISPFGLFTRPIGYAAAFLFILLAGFSSQLSKNNARRSIKIWAAAFAITSVTGALSFIPTIRFGILHFMAAAIMIFELTRPLINKIPAKAGVLGFVILFILTYGLPEGNIVGIALPNWLYQTKELAWLGLPSPSFQSGDYYPVLPYLFLFLAGVMIARLVDLDSPPRQLQKSYLPALGFMGRHSLLIYFIHQPIVYGLVYLFKTIT